MIKLSRVYKEYSVGSTIVPVLSNVTLSLKDHELISIVGPSGSGKSTLMHLLGFLDTPTRGLIQVDNKNIHGLNDTELSRLRNKYIGFVFQQFNLIPKLTVLENVILPTVYTHNTLNFQTQNKAMEILRNLGILAKAKSYPNTLSGGEQQRVAIARALIMSPRVILADEPTGNLDTKTGKDIINLLLSLYERENISIVIVTHDPAIAKRTPRNIKIRDGKIV